MARSTQIVLIDDIDGGSAHETVIFGLDGVSYEIDLSKANASRLRKALAPYTEKGLRTGGRRAARSVSARSRTRRSGTSSGRDIPAIRSWAKKKGLIDSERGRIPVLVIEAYDAAH